ncbi:MAG: cyanophycinase [Bdellovibrionales bacterium]
MTIAKKSKTKPTKKNNVQKELINQKLRTRKAHKAKGVLIIIGGNEDKEQQMDILKLVAQRAGRGKIVVVTAASEIPHEVWPIYRNVFKSFNVDSAHLHIEQPADYSSKHYETIFDGATAVFFTGGDQLKITTKIGGSMIFGRIREIFKKGGLVAGTSAGAAIMGELMLVGTENTESHKVGHWMMAPGLGFTKSIIIDQHFAQRARIGRLLKAIAVNPGILGVGIDENTAIVVENEGFQVVGENAVYVIDGTHISYTNVAEASLQQAMSMHDVRLHILSNGEFFDLSTRQARSS